MKIKSKPSCMDLIHVQPILSDKHLSLGRVGLMRVFCTFLTKWWCCDVDVSTVSPVSTNFKHIGQYRTITITSHHISLFASEPSVCSPARLGSQVSPRAPDTIRKKTVRNGARKIMKYHENRYIGTIRKSEQNLNDHNDHMMRSEHGPHKRSQSQTNPKKWI